MAEPRVSNQWQLQDTGESLEQWKLQDEEQRLPAHMELQDEYDNRELMDAAWQPIDYHAMQAAAAGKSRRGGVALGVLLAVALLAVAGYLAVYYLGGQDLTTLIPGFGAAATAPDANGASDAVAAGSSAESAPVDMSNKAASVVTDTAQTTASAGAGSVAPAVVPTGTATVTVPAATPVAVATVAPAAPLLPATAEVRQAVMNSQLGVNMRATAAVTGELLATLDDKTTHIVAGGPTVGAAGGNWYELALPDKTRGWVSGDFITVTVKTLPYAEAQALLASVGLTLTAPSAAEPLPVGTPLTATVVTTPAVAAPVTAPSVATNAPVVSLTAVISAPAGLNLRREPQSGDNVIELLAATTPISVIGRSADGAWVQVQLADKRRGWLSAAFVSVTGDLNTIALGTSYPLTETVAAAVAPTLALTATAPALAAPVAASPATTATAAAGDAQVVGGFTVASAMGVKLRKEPGTEDLVATLSWNTTGQTLGRSADSKWVKVLLPGGQTGWVAASAVALDGDLEALPIVE